MTEMLSTCPKCGVEESLCTRCLNPMPHSSSPGGGCSNSTECQRCKGGPRGRRDHVGQKEEGCERPTAGEVERMAEAQEDRCPWLPSHKWENINKAGSFVAFNDPTSVDLRCKVCGKVYSKSEEVAKLDLIKAPGHYTWIPGIECKDVVKHFPWAIGSAIKYLWRAGRKDDATQDLEKAIECIRIEIDRLKLVREKQ